MTRHLALEGVENFRDFGGYATGSGARLRAGALLLTRGVPAVAANDQGYVTSAAFSPTLGHWIALALLKRGPLRHGETIVAHDPVRGGDTLALVCPPVFVDPQGERLRG